MEKKKHLKKYKTINKMPIITCIFAFTLSVNRFNAPTKRHGLAEWMQKQDPHILFSTKDAVQI